MNLLGDTNDTASGAGTSVTSLLGLLVATTAEVISTGVDDDGTLFAISTTHALDIYGGLLHTPRTLSAPINLTSLSWTEPTALP